MSARSRRSDDGDGLKSVSGGVLLLCISNAIALSQPSSVLCCTTIINELLAVGIRLLVFQNL